MALGIKLGCTAAESFHGLLARILDRLTPRFPLWGAGFYPSKGSFCL